MTIEEIFKLFMEKGIFWVIVCSGIVQFAPIRINPWTWLLKKIGNIINSEVIEKMESNKKETNENIENMKKENNEKMNKLQTDIDNMKKDLTDHINESGENKMEEIRLEIINFGDEISFGKKYSKGKYLHMIKNIDRYNTYCTNHPNFQNSLTHHAAKLINEDYSKRLKNNDFDS